MADPPALHPPSTRSLAALVTAVAGLITAVGAIIKPADHSVTQASYEELTAAVKTLQDQASKDHDDLVALRAYVAGREAQAAPLPSASSSSSSASSSGSSVPAPTGTSFGGPHDAARPFASSAPSSLPFVPPPVHDPAARYDLPAFDKVVRKAAQRKKTE